MCLYTIALVRSKRARKLALEPIPALYGRVAKEGAGDPAIRRPSGLQLRSAVPVRVQDIALVPISVSYDRPAEEGALVTELSGIPKEKESLASLLAAAGSLAVGGAGRKSKRGREAIGADIMRVGEIVTLERFLAVRRG